MKKKGLTLHTIVSFIVIFSVLLTLSISSVVGYKYEHNVLLNSTLEFNKANADKLAQTTNQILSSLQKSLADLVPYFSKNRGSEQVRLCLDLLHKSNSNFNSVFYVDKDAVVQGSSPSGLDVDGMKLTTEATSQAIASRAPQISEPYVGVLGRLIILVSHPVFDAQGDYQGFIAGAVYLHELNIFETMLGTHPERNSGSYIFVVTSKGNILYHPDKERIGESVIQNKVVEAVVAGKSGEQVVINSLGVKMTAGFAPVATTGWGIISQTPYSTIVASSLQTITKVLIYSIPFVLLYIFAVYFFIRYISAPLYKLARYAASLTDDARSQEFPQIHHMNYEATQLHTVLKKTFSTLHHKFDALTLEAHTDPLTGLYNRRGMELCLEQWQETQTPYAILLIDVDHFKRVNDTYGHKRGDEVLVFLAEQVNDIIRGDDICCRYGGEEFVVLAPGTDIHEGFYLAERIRHHLEKKKSPIGEVVTISVGVSASLGGSIDDSVIARADEALYASKSDGRNRVTKR